MLHIWGNLTTIISIALALITFFNPSQGRSELIVISFLVLATGVPLLIYSRFSKISFLGLNYELLTKVNSIKKRIISNQVIVTKESGFQEWFWLDEAGLGHRIPDSLTAEFLSRGNGILKISRSEFRTVSGSFPSFKTEAKIRFKAQDVFIQYNGTIYYQSSLSWLYKLAGLNSIQFEKDDFRLWKYEDGSPWEKEITPVEFVNSRVI